MSIMVTSRDENIIMKNKVAADVVKPSISTELVVDAVKIRNIWTELEV
jgi:hypothetical protein